MRPRGFAGGASGHADGRTLPERSEAVKHTRGHLQSCHGERATGITWRNLDVDHEREAAPGLP
jgi:hypothetical protein